MKGDKRKEKRIEQMKQKAAEQTTPEEEIEQLKISIRNGESTLEMQQDKIALLEEQIQTGNITYKDDEFIDGKRPMFKMKYILRQEKFLLEDMKNGMEEMKSRLKKLEDDRAKEPDKTST